MSNKRFILFIVSLKEYLHVLAERRPRFGARVLKMNANVKIICVLAAVMVASGSVMPFLATGLVNMRGSKHSEEVYTVINRSSRPDTSAEGYSEQSLELYPNEESGDTSVTLGGVMPEGASAEAVDVTGEYDIETLSGLENTSEVSPAFGVSALDSAAGNGGESSATLLAAYDISISDKKGRDFQPDENEPILVEIVNSGISADGYTELWHVTDSGERERIIDFVVSEGKISFYASGFSVYAIITDAVAPTEVPEEGWYKIKSLDELSEFAEAGKGFYIGCNNGGYYFKNIVKKNKNKNIYGIEKTAGSSNAPPNGDPP